MSKGIGDGMGGSHRTGSSEGLCKSRQCYCRHDAYRQLVEVPTSKFLLFM